MRNVRQRIACVGFLLAAAWPMAGRNAVVADSVSRQPLSGASVFDRRGTVVGVTNGKGVMPYVGADEYPITVRYLGYEEKTIGRGGNDTILLSESVAELPEVVVESRRHKVLHMLGYVREYSTLSTYTDTVFLFREKTVDYMVVDDPKVRFRGWETPRVLGCRSYYRFTNSEGVDSVSDVSNHHFSWSDWMGVAPGRRLPGILAERECGSDTLRGKYSATEIWSKTGSRVSVDVDVLADSAGRRWVPNLAAFFRYNLDFENFRVRYNYDNVAGDTAGPADLTGYTYTIASNGRGRGMFMFNKVDEPFDVNTYAEVYITDKEYITVKEARNREKLHFKTEDMCILEPPDAPGLQPAICELVERVNNIDRDQVRTDIAPDRRMICPFDPRRNFTAGQRLLGMLKMMTGISAYKSRRNLNNHWDSFRRDRARQNSSPPREEE